MSEPHADPFPALVAHLRSWVAQHADLFNGGYLLPSPGCLDLYLVHSPSSPKQDVFDPDIQTLRDDLNMQILQSESWPDGPCFGVSILPGVGQEVDWTGYIPLESPDAASLIADRIRTADELRAELERVTAERDAAHNELARIVSLSVDGLPWPTSERGRSVRATVGRGYTSTTPPLDDEGVPP